MKKYLVTALPVAFQCLILSALLAGCYEEGNPRTDAYIPKTHALELHQKAVRALRDGDAARGLKLIDEAVEFDPGYAAAHDTRAKILARLGRFAEAGAAEGEAVRLNPDFAEGHIFHGVFLELAGTAEEAKPAYERALALYDARRERKALNPEDAVNRVIALYLFRGMLEATPVIHEVLKDYPNHGAALLVRDRLVENDRTKFLEAMAAPDTGGGG